MMTSLRFRLLTAEVLRNLRSYSALTASIVVLIVLFGVSTTVTSGMEAASIEAEQRALIARGTDVFSVRSETLIDVGECDALRGVDGVADAGASIERLNATVLALPGSSLVVNRATAGYARIVWGLKYLAAPVGIGSEVSDALGLRPNQQVRLQSVETRGAPLTLTVGVKFSPTQRVAGANQELLIVDLPWGRAVECLVKPEAGAQSAVERLLIATFDDASVAPLAQVDSDLPSPSERLRSRTSFWIPVAVGVTILLLLAVQTFARRADWALTRLLGARATDILMMATIETLVVAWVPFALGATAGLLFVAATLPIGAMTATMLAYDVLRASSLLLGAPLLMYVFAGRNATNHFKGQ